MKPSLTVEQQVRLLASRGLVVGDVAACRDFLTSTNYYRFSGYARYFQRAPHEGDDTFVEDTRFESVRYVYDADEDLRALLARPLAQVELLLRTAFARAVASSNPYGTYLTPTYYRELGNDEPTIDACFRDLDRSKERHIVRFRAPGMNGPTYPGLPVWSAVEAWSFGTLSKAIERADGGAVSRTVAESLGLPVAGFSTRVRALVYLRNRCAHHARLWHHSVINAGPTPRNVRGRAKRLYGQFEPRSVVDVIASLDDITSRTGVADPLLAHVYEKHLEDPNYWNGLAVPLNPVDHL